MSSLGSGSSELAAEDADEVREGEGVPLGMTDERLRSAVEAAEVGTWHLDLETRLDTRDASLNRILGLKPVTTTLHADDFFSRVVEEDRPRAIAALEAAVERTGRYDVELRIRRPDGEIRWIRDVGRIGYGPDGRAVYATGAATDITELTKAQRAVAESASFYEQTLESVSVTTFTATPDGACDYVSRQWVAFTGRPATDSYGDGWLGVLHPDDRERAFAAWRAAVEGKGEYALEYRVRRHDGQYEWFKVRGSALYDASGEIARWIGTAVNVNDLKQTEAALRESEERLRIADRRKDEFLATLAHELRNPLAPVRSGLDVLKLTRDETTRHRAEQTIERQIHHMVRLVDDLLDVSRISRGQVELQRTRLPLSEVVEMAVETSKPAIEERGHTLSISIDDSSLCVDGDLTRLAQVVANLLNNAAKYTPDGGRIRLDVHGEGGEAVIRIADTGIGIEAHVLPRVFDLFTRAAHHGAQAEGGLGLGLFLVQDLVKMHGGTVSAESAGLGKGSTFTVRLPKAGAPATVEGSERSSVRGTNEGACRRILVVDDNVDAAEMLATMLELRGHETRIAHDGPDALAAAKEVHPDVIFLDIGLPGMDGYEVARQLRADKELAPTVLVAVTGWGTTDDKLRARAAGFDRHLTKPVDIDAVDAAVEQSRPTA